METLINDYKTMLDSVDTTFVRYLHDEVNWNARLVAILGARGVGKTTLLLQHIKLHDDVERSLYVLGVARGRLRDRWSHLRGGRKEQG